MRNNIRSGLLFLLTALFAFALAGCGAAGSSGSSSGSASSSAISNENASGSSVVSEASVEIPPTSSQGKMYAIVLDSSDFSLTVQSDLGDTVTFSYTKKTDLSGLSNGLASGAAVEIDYTGKIQGTNGKKAKVSKNLDSSKQPTAPSDALAAAGQVILAIENGDIGGFSEWCSFPLVYDNGNDSRIGTRQALISMKKSHIFTKSLVNAVSNTNLFMTTNYADGILLGRSEPNIVLQNTSDGWRVTGIHLK